MTLRTVFNLPTLFGVVICAYLFLGVFPRLWRGDPRLVKHLRSLLVDTSGLSERAAFRILGSAPAAGVAASLFTASVIASRLRNVHEIPGQGVGVLVDALFVGGVVFGLLHLSAMFSGRPRAIVPPVFRDRPKS